MDINDSLMRLLKQTIEMFGIREEEVFEENELPTPKRITNGKAYKILVCGGRHFESYGLLKVVLGKLIEKFHIDISTSEIISGHCQGADMLGEKYAEEYGISVKCFPADWKNINARQGLYATSK